MSVTSSTTRTAFEQAQSPLLRWVDRNKGKWAGWILITIVVVYVAFLILTPITALAFGAFEQGPGEIIASLSQPGILQAFWNTLWISLVVVTIHTIFGTIVAWCSSAIVSLAAT